MGRLCKTLINMDDAVCVKEEKTLINAVDRLESTVKRFEELAKLSDRLMAKLERTEGLTGKKEITDVKGPINSQPDIIDLFNSLNGRFNNLLDQIGSNVERATSMVE